MAEGKMEDIPVTFNFPKSHAAWVRGNDLDDVLEEELALIASDLAQDACSHTGGWPNDEHFVVNDVVDEGSRLKINVTVTFTELIPSSCKDSPYIEQRRSDHVLTMEKDGDLVFVDYPPSDDEQLDLADWNSAGDGT